VRTKDGYVPDGRLAISIPAFKMEPIDIIDSTVGVSISFGRGWTPGQYHERESIAERAGTVDYGIQGFWSAAQSWKITRLASPWLRTSASVEVIAMHVT